MPQLLLLRHFCFVPGRGSVFYVCTSCYFNVNPILCQRANIQIRISIILLNLLKYFKHMRKSILSLLAVLAHFSLAHAQPCRPNTSALSLNGTSNYAVLASEANVNPSNAITVEAWIRPAAFATTKDNGSIVCNHGWSSGGQQGFVLRCGGTGVLSFNIAGTTTGASTGAWREVFSGPNVLSLATWQHVAGTFDGDSLKLFVNGNQVAATAFAGTIANSPSAYPMTIGRLADPSQTARRYFNGLIDEVRIWNRALDGAELLANSTKELDSLSVQGLGGYWRFNENTGTSSYDASGNGQTVNIISGNWDVNVPFNVQLPQPPSITLTAVFTLTSSYATGNQWYRNGAPIQGATQQQLVVTQNGTYTVDHTDTAGCRSPESQPVQVTTVASQELGQETFRAWPVPCNGQLNLQLPKIGELEILGLDGRLLERRSIQVAGLQTIETSHWPKGIYLVRFFDEQASFQLKVSRQ